MKFLMGVLALLSVNTLATPTIPSFNYEDFKCLVENAYHEARGEGIKGMQAVTQVVLNRAQKSGETACQVVYKPWAFSWTMDKKRKAQPASFWATDSHARGARRAAATALRLWPEQGHPNANGGKEQTKIYLATHYHEIRVRPAWASKMEKLGRVGNHVFYR